MTRRDTQLSLFVRLTCLVVLQLYLLQVGATACVTITDSHEAETDACCDVCSAGGPCCCLALAGVTSCDLSLLKGPWLRPAPCGGMGAAAVLPTVAAAADHLLPQRPSLVPPELPAGASLPILQRAHSVRLSPPDKIPIV